VEVDDRREYEQPLLQAINAIGNALLQQQKYFLHAADDSLLSREQERPGALSTRIPCPLEELAARARDVRPTVLGQLGTECQAIERCATDGALLPEYADQSLCEHLEKFGPKPAQELARDWRDAQLALYEELLDREEPGTRGDTVLGRLRSAMARRDWEATFRELESVDRASEHGVETVAALGELLGDRLQRFGRRDLAERAWSLSEAAFSEFASWATGGGEGLARMVDVNRLRARRGLPHR
jgi:hypothetical protein